MAYKDTALYTEKRRAKRIHVPMKSTALYSDGSGSKDRIYIRDISVVGMLLCDYFGSSKKHPIDSWIYDIFIEIPPSGSITGSATSFLIDKGKVVRSFIDQSTDSLCYGIEFAYENRFVKEKIRYLVISA